MGLFPVAAERVVLRCLMPEDAKRVESYANDRDIARNTANIPYPYPAGLAEAWIAGSLEAMRGGKAYELAIADKATNQLVGSVSLRIDDFAKGGEIGYWIGRPHWRKGYAFEALQKLCVVAFNRLALPRLWAGILPGNAASCGLVEKLGFVVEGEDDYEYPAHRMTHRVLVYGLKRAAAAKSRLGAPIHGGLFEP